MHTDDQVQVEEGAGLAWFGWGWMGGLAGLSWLVSSGSAGLDWLCWLGWLGWLAGLSGLADGFHFLFIDVYRFDLTISVDSNIFTVILHSFAIILIVILFDLGPSPQFYSFYI